MAAGPPRPRARPQPLEQRGVRPRTAASIRPVGLARPGSASWAGERSPALLWYKVAPETRIELMRPLNLLRAVLVLLVTAVLVSCTSQPGLTPTPTIPPTVPPSPTPNIGLNAAAGYLAAWAANDYPAMYALLAPESQSALALADFEKQYTDNLGIMGALSVAGQVTGASESGASAQVQAHLKFTTRVVGDLETDITLNLKKSGAEWRVVFDPTLIWPDLHDGQKLWMAPLT